MYVRLILWFFNSITVGYRCCVNRRCCFNRRCCVNRRCCFNRRSCKSRHLRFSSRSENIYVCLYSKKQFSWDRSKLAQLLSCCCRPLNGELTFTARRPRCSVRALPGRTSQSIEDRLHHDKCHAVSWPRLFRTPRCSTSRLAPDATGSQEASVPTWNSRMFWQFGEYSAREPSLPLPSLNWGPEATYRSGQTGIGLLMAWCWPLVPPWILLQWFSPGSMIHHLLNPHRWCRRKSTMCHLLENFDIVHVLTEAFLGFPCMFPDSPISTIYYTELWWYFYPT